MQDMLRALARLTGRAMTRDETGDSQDIDGLTRFSWVRVQDDGGILGMDGFFGTEGGGHVNTRGGTINAGISLRGGDDRVNIALGGTLRSLDAGEGNDSLTLSARVIQNVDAGAGNDRLAVAAEAVGHLDTGSGDDVLALSAVFVNGVDLGEGDDGLSLSAAVVNGVHVGEGADHLAVSVTD